MYGELIAYTVVYFLGWLIFILPPDEITSIGLTVECILSFYLGSEMNDFIRYHQRRSAATLIVHSLFLPGYVILMSQYSPLFYDMVSSFYSLYRLFMLSLAPTFIVLCIIARWKQNNWRLHPLSENLTLFSNVSEPVDPDAWVAVATEINIQYRRVDKLSTKVSSCSRIISTDDWLIKTGPYSVQVLPLLDTLVVIEGSFKLSGAQSSSSLLNAQTLRLRARSVTENIPQMTFRLGSLLLPELERKLRNPIVNLMQIEVEKSLSDQFLKVFVENVHRNPKLEIQISDPDSCIGCMSRSANVKLERLCKNERVIGAAEGNCEHCDCRPLWCITCLSHWFAARQDQDSPDTWLSSRAPCPTCRSPFCLLDVRLID